MINVTQTFLPPIEEYQRILSRAWDKRWLTNRGELALELEGKLDGYLGTDGIIITSNGTVPLQIALKLLGKRGEIITTPFSYVATSAAIVWEGCMPVFVDIDPRFLTIDEKLIEAAITPETTAILATHVFGNPCAVDQIESVAEKHGLAVIYDAAHAFGVRYNGKSLFSFGDVSTCSFHATKLFHTGEGGAMFCRDETLRHKLFYSHNFGHNGPLDFYGLGINGKISELQAAMGLAVFPHLGQIIAQRREAVSFYDAHLGQKLQRVELRPGTEWNYSYYPMIFSSEPDLLRTQRALEKQSIFPRRYFYPSLNTVEYLKGPRMPVSESIAQRILCLPLFAGMETADLERIVRIVNENA
jgi:dTDP-4-amino-4,6-dideoxygalactose transaminase